MEMTSHCWHRPLPVLFGGICFLILLRGCLFCVLECEASRSICVFIGQIARICRDDSASGVDADTKNMSHQTLESIQIRSIANDLHVWLAISAKPPERGLSSTPQRITPTRVGALLEDRHANEIPSFSPRSEPFKLQLPTRLSNEDEDRLFRERGKRTGGTAVIKFPLK